MKPVCRIGTRKSALAKTQSRWVAGRLETVGVDCELVEMDSRGDKDRINPLYEIETDSPGLFCKQLQEALLANQIDIAVHSLKDLPTLPIPGLEVAAIPLREVPLDILLIHPERVAEGLPMKLREGATVGTSSLRREAQILEARRDLKVVPLRGNVPSRVAQVREAKLDAAILAGAGLKRLALDLQGVVSVPLPSERFIPAPGQGALAVEIRTDLRTEWAAVVRALGDAETTLCVRIERRILREMEGGCTLPLGVLCRREVGDALTVRTFLGKTTHRGDGRRDWVSFHRFDISGTDEETLVAETVRFFKGRSPA